MNAPRRAFTLFEVLISIAIFLLLAGGIFASVQAAFSASNQVALSQLDSERAEAFQNLLRKFFATLPPETKVELRQRRLSGRGDVVELLAWPVPAFLRFGENANDGVALAGLPDGRGNFRVSLGYFSADDPPEKRDRVLEEGTWLPLLPDVKTLTWRLAPARNPVLTDKWDTASGRPGLAELSYQTTSGAGGTYAYWIPPLQRRLTGPAANPGAPADGGGGGGPPKPPEDGGDNAETAPEENAPAP